MARPEVIIGVTVWDPSGSVIRREQRESDVTEYSTSLPITFSKRDHWVRYDNGERAWLASGMAFVVEWEELP